MKRQRLPCRFGIAQSQLDIAFNYVVQASRSTPLYLLGPAIPLAEPAGESSGAKKKPATPSQGRIRRQQSAEGFTASQKANASGHVSREGQVQEGPGGKQTH